MATNREGLTFQEWKNAANFGRKIEVDIKVARKAWGAGEDPTEYSSKED